MKCCDLDLLVHDLKAYVEEIEYNFQQRTKELESEIELLKAELNRVSTVNYDYS